MTLRALLTALTSIAVFVTGCSGPEEDAMPVGEHFQYSVRATNGTQRSIPRAQLWLPFPSTMAASQRVSAVEVALPHTVVGTGDGNQQIYLEFTDVPVGFDQRIDVDAWIEFGANADAGEADRDFLAPGPGVESDDVAIRERAAEFEREDADATAAAILAWVGDFETDAELPREEASFVPSSDAPAPGEESEPASLPYGASHLLETGSGTELDRMMLAVALLRAAGVPARMVLGFAAEAGAPLSSEHLEPWIEYAVGGEWRSALEPGDEGGEGIRRIVFRVIEDPLPLRRGRAFAALHRAVGLRAELVN